MSTVEPGAVAGPGRPERSHAPIYPARRTGRTERQAELDALLDDQLAGTLSLAVDGRPVGGPPALSPATATGSLLHGSTGAGRAARRAAGDARSSSASFALDGIVVAHSTFESSANYRSAVVEGTAEVLDGAAKSRGPRAVLGPAAARAHRGGAADDGQGAGRHPRPRPAHRRRPAGWSRRAPAGPTRPTARPTRGAGSSRFHTVAGLPEPAPWTGATTPRSPALGRTRVPAPARSGDVTRATGLGSWPGTDPREAAVTVRDLLERRRAGCPTCPSCPAAGPVPISSAGAPGCSSTCRSTSSPPDGGSSTARAGTRPRTAALRDEDLDVAAEAYDGYAGDLKIQVAGPWTLAASVELNRGERAVVDEGASPRPRRVARRGGARSSWPMCPAGPRGEGRPPARRALAPGRPRRVAADGVRLRPGPGRRPPGGGPRDPERPRGPRRTDGAALLPPTRPAAPHARDRRVGAVRRPHGRLARAVGVGRHDTRGRHRRCMPVCWPPTAADSGRGGPSHRPRRPRAGRARGVGSSAGSSSPRPAAWPGSPPRGPATFIGRRWTWRVS